jgi:hypothetical protein
VSAATETWNVPSGLRRPRALALLLIVAGGAAAAVIAFVGSDRDATPATLPAQLSQSAFEEAAGVRVVRVAVTGGGGLVDLRYQIVDPDKAAAIHASATPPKLIDERTGKAVDRLWMHHGASGTPRAGQSYFLLFVDGKRVLASGSSVSVVLAGARLDHVLVQ